MSSLIHGHVIGECERRRAHGTAGFIGVIGAVDLYHSAEVVVLIDLVVAVDVFGPVGLAELVLVVGRRAVPEGVPDAGDVGLDLGVVLIGDEVPVVSSCCATGAPAG